MDSVSWRRAIRRRLQERYGLLTIGEDVQHVFDQIGALRKVYTTGGEVEYDKVAELIVHDIRNEHLGKLTFDFTSHHHHELADADTE